MPFGVIDLVPPSAIQVGPISVGLYGLGYVVAIAVMLLVSQREARWRGVDPSDVTSGIAIVAVLALVGARLYHVIHEWPRYADDLARVVLPPYSGLGLYGGIFGATLGVWLVARMRGHAFARALDIVVPGTFLAQGIARWGNFFNQELYGPPTDLPFAILIDCAHRVAPLFCPGDARLGMDEPGVALDAGFHPLFLYESVLTLAGGLVALALSRRAFGRLRDGDLASLWMAWYGTTRLALEPLRAGDHWELAGVPVASLVGVVLVALGVATFVRRHRRPGPGDAAPARPPGSPA